MGGGKHCSLFLWFLAGGGGFELFSLLIVKRAFQTSITILVHPFEATIPTSNWSHPKACHYCSFCVSSYDHCSLFDNLSCMCLLLHVFWFWIGAACVPHTTSRGFSSTRWACKQAYCKGEHNEHSSKENVCLARWSVVFLEYQHPPEGAHEWQCLPSNTFHLVRNKLVAVFIHVVMDVGLQLKS